MNDFMNTYHVSRETFDILSRYVNILTEWQSKMNLVSPKSLDQIWTRHIADSAQLFAHLNSDSKLVYDIGSGAGFPAIVLAVMSKAEHRDTKFKLIESITKKTVYLNRVKEITGLSNVDILNCRAEKLNKKLATGWGYPSRCSFRITFFTTPPLRTIHQGGM